MKERLDENWQPMGEVLKRIADRMEQERREAAERAKRIAAKEEAA